MSKNLTRKGLALGAVVALSSTLIAGSPAFAANEVTLAPTAGSTYGAIAGQDFVLQATTGATISSSSYSKLKYEVLNASGLELTTTFVQAGSAADTDLSASTATTAQVVRTTTAAASITGSISTLTLNVPAASAGAVVVNAWIDSNDNNVIDTASEFSAGSQTVTFVKPADITWTNTLTQPVLGDTKLVASLSASNNINLGQYEAAIDFGFATLASGVYTAVTQTTVDTAGAFTVGEAATFVAASNTLTVSETLTAAATTYYVSQAILGSLELGTESVKATAAATISGFQSVTSTTGDNVSINGSAISVRNGATTVPVSALAYKTGTTKAAAGIPVTVTITESTVTGNTDAAKFVAGGKTLADTTSAADKIEFVVNTNADGKVVFDIAVSGTVAAADAIVIAVAAQNQTATATASFVAAAATQLVDSNVIGASAILKKASASTFELKYAAVDSFGKGLGSGFRVKLTESAATPDVVAFADVVNGVASFSVTDKTTLTESYVAVLEVYSASTGTYATAVNNSALGALVPVIGTSTAPETLTLTGTAASLDLNLSALAAADTRKGEDAPTVITSGTISTLSGTVVDLVGSGTYADVTLSATGALFEANGVYALGSITVQSNATGAFGGVKLYSNKSGDTVVTATAAGKTKTLTVTFDDAAAGTATSWTVDAPASIVPGRTLAITPVVTDKWGNKVADVISFTYAGPGLPITTGSVTANSEFKVLLGAGDAGTATVTVKFSTNADSDFVDDVDVTVAKTITIGAAAVVVVAPKAAVIATKNGRVYVTVNYAAGFKAYVKVGFSSKPAFTTTGSKLVSYYVGAGKRVAVRVYVRGGIVASQAVTVK